MTDPEAPLITWALAKLSLAGVVPVGATLKFVVDVAEPFALVTTIGPLTAPIGTTTLRPVPLPKVCDGAATPPKVMLVAPAKFAPVRVTITPAGPDAGENDVMVGADCARATSAIAIQAAKQNAVLIESVTSLLTELKKCMGARITCS